MDPDSGAQALLPEHYERLCELLASKTTQKKQELHSTSTFGWLFLVLLWTLVSRPDVTVL